MSNVYKIVDCELKEKIPLGKLRPRLEDIIKMDPREMGFFTS
jgi:hypothetical protein